MWPNASKDGCSTLAGNNCYQAFAIIANASLHQRGGILAHSSQNCFISATLEGLSMKSPFKFCTAEVGLHGCLGFIVTPVYSPSFAASADFCC